MVYLRQMVSQLNDVFCYPAAPFGKAELAVYSYLHVIFYELKLLISREQIFLAYFPHQQMQDVR